MDLSATPNHLRVGYGKADITPVAPVPLGGYGNGLHRISTGIGDPMYATCIAITDETDHTVLLFGIDYNGTGGPVFRQLRKELAQELGLKEESVIISASHMHSSPDLWVQHEGITAYIPILAKGLRDAAAMALEDRAAAQLYIGDIQTERLNFVRRYQLENGRFVGYESDIKESGLAVVGHETEADGQLQLLKFKRQGRRDVLLANFQVHPHRGGGSKNTLVTADLVGVFRNRVKEALGCDVIYITGGSGNVNPYSAMKQEHITADYIEQGQALAAYAIKADDTLRPVKAGAVRVAAQTFDGEVDHSTDPLVPVAKEAVAYFKETGSVAQMRAKYLAQGIHSPNHAGMIINRSTKESWPFDIWAVSIGDVAFAVAPYEMFDTQGLYIKKHSPYAMTVITTCANGAYGYIPSKLASEHGGYEADNTYYAPGCAERLADMYLEMLNRLYTNREYNKDSMTHHPNMDEERKLI